MGRASWGFVMLVAMLAFANTATAQWQPLPPPDAQEMLHWEPLNPEQRSVVLKPGDSWEVEPSRLQVVRFQFRPIEADPLLSVVQVDKLESGGELTAVLEPIRTGPGDWVFLTSMQQERPLRVTLNPKAKFTVEVGGFGMQTIEPWVYWEWWQTQLHAWWSQGQGPPPEGVSIAGQAQVLGEAKRAELLVELVKALGGSTAELAAAKHLGHAFLLRGVQQVRRPRTRFYTRRDAIAALDDKPREFRVDTGDRVDTTVQLDPGLDEVLVVDGPAVVRLGVRAIKELDRPDIVSKFGIRVFNGQGTQVHDDTFSSRAARRDQTEAQGQENPIEEEDEPNLDVQYVTDTRGRIVGWRRSTQWWVPPGRHRLRLEIEGSKVLFDGDVYRPRTHVEDAVVRIEDAGFHIHEAEKLLKAGSVPSELLRLEITGYLQNNPRVETLANALEKSDAYKHSKRAKIAQRWLLYTRLRWSPESVNYDNALEQAVKDAQPAPLRHQLAFAAARRAIDGGRPDLALRLVNSAPNDTFESEDALLVRAEAMMLGGRDHVARWSGLAMLYRAWKDRPYDVRLRKSTQKAWWYRTFWLPLTRASRRSAEIRLEPLGEASERIYVAEIKERTTLLYKPTPGNPFLFRLARAPDVEDRLVRARVFAWGDTPNVHSISLNDQPFGLTRAEASEHFDFAVAPGEQSLVVKDDSNVLVGHPPEHRLDISLAEVFERRRYWTVDQRGTEWNIGDSKDARFIRVRIHPTAPNQAGTLIFDDGIRAHRTLDFAGLNPNNPPMTSVFEIPAGISTIRLKSTTDVAVLASLDLRVAKSPPPVDPIHEPVVLPPDQDRLARLQKLSRAIASGPVPKRASERLERAVLLMSLDRDKLARVDLEAVLEDPHTGLEELVQAQGRYEAVKLRLRKRLLELKLPWLQGESAVPMTIGAALTESNANNCAAITQGATDADDAWPDDCVRVWHYLSARNNPATGLGHFRAIASTAGKFAFLAQTALAGFILDLIESLEEGKAANLEPGLAAEAYGNARLAMMRFPMSGVRSKYYRGLRWSQWESVPTQASGRFLAELNPHVPALNLDAFKVPTTSDPNVTLVDYAMTGTDWKPEDASKVFALGRRTIRFKPLAPAILEVESTCVDLRPDLQPEQSGAPLACQLFPNLAADGESVDAESVGGTFLPGQVYVVRFPVKAGVNYRLRIERGDDLAGRLAITRPRLLPPNDTAAPVTPMLKRRLDMVSAALPAEVSVAGPVFVRFEARALQPDAATKMRVEMTGPNGEESRFAFDLSPAVQPGATLNELSLNNSRRHEFWLPFRGATRIRFVPDQGFATLRVSLRVDDYDQLLRAKGRGWLDVDALTPPEPTPDWEEPEAPDVASLVTLDYLLHKRRITASGRVDLRYETRDLALLEDLAPADGRDAPYVSLLGGGLTRLPQFNLWFDGRAGIRTTFKNPPVGQFYGGGYWREDYTGLRIEPDFRVYAQSAGELLWSGRTFLRVSRPWLFLPDFMAIPALRFVGRFQNNDALRISDGEADPIIFSDYAQDHPLTTELVAAFWYTPFVNMRAIGSIVPVLNPNFTIDQLRIDAGAVAMLASTRVKAKYGFRWLFGDDARELGQPIHEFDIQGRLGYWAAREHLVFFDLWTRIGIVPGDDDVTRFRFGISASYWFSETGLEDWRPSTKVYGDLLQPKYFN